VWSTTKTASTSTSTSSPHTMELIDSLVTTKQNERINMSAIPWWLMLRLGWSRLVSRHGCSVGEGKHAMEFIDSFGSSRRTKQWAPSHDGRCCYFLGWSTVCSESSTRMFGSWTHINHHHHHSSRSLSHLLLISTNSLYLVWIGKWVRLWTGKERKE